MKQIVAVSRAEYRGVPIFENATGFTVVLGELEYPVDSLSEARSLIDAAKMFEALADLPEEYLQ